MMYIKKEIDALTESFRSNLFIAAEETITGTMSHNKFDRDLISNIEDFFARLMSVKEQEKSYIASLHGLSLDDDAEDINDLLMIALGFDE